MRPLFRRCFSIVAVCSLTLTTVGVSPASAYYGPDDPAWIMQVGDLQGRSRPVIQNFSLRTTLYSLDNFQRPNYPRYLAWGLVQTNLGMRLAMAKSNQGTAWTQPEMALLEVPGNLGVTIPFLLNDVDGYADVLYNPDAALNPPAHPFEIWYRVEGSDPTSVGSIHHATSANGVLWEQDQSITQPGSASLPDPFNSAEGDPLLVPCSPSQPPSWKCGSLGPTDVIRQPGDASSLPCTPTTEAGGRPFPWDCRYVMVYDTFSAGEDTLHYAGLAGSSNGINWAARANPVLSPGTAGAWDDAATTMAHVRLPSATGPSVYTMYYSGGRQPPDACANGLAPCWELGVATSADGITWTKAATNPATPRSLIEEFTDATANPVALWFPQPLDNRYNPTINDHILIYFVRASGGPTGGATGTKDTFLASTSAAPSQAPTLIIGSPISVGNYTSPAVWFWVCATDTLGTTIGVDASTLELRLDGVLFDPASYQTEYSLVCGYKYHSLIVSNWRLVSAGTHTFTASVRDLEGNLSTASVSFTVNY